MSVTHLLRPLRLSQAGGLGGIVDQACLLRLESERLGLRRPFTVAESLVVALVARGASYREASVHFGATVSTVATHARVAAEKVLDGSTYDAELERMRPRDRLLVWSQRLGIKHPTAQSAKERP